MYIEAIRGIQFRWLGATIGIAAIWLMAMVSPAQAEDEDERPEWTISAECRMILVPQKLAFGLIEELGDSAKVDEAWVRVQEMISRGEIEAVAIVIGRGIPNQPLTAKTGEEVRYPTQYDSPNLPVKLSDKDAVAVLKAMPVVAITPVSFEARQAGCSLEIDAEVLNKGDWLNVKVTALHERLLRWTKFDIGRLVNGERMMIEQPVFHTMQNTGRLHVRNGQRVLLGVHRSPDAQSKSYELFILRVTATPLPPAQ